LTGAIGIHHEELAIGLRNVVVEWVLVFESQAGAAKENVLSMRSHLRERRLDRSDPVHVDV